MLKSFSWFVWCLLAVIAMAGCNSNEEQRLLERQAIVGNVADSLNASQAEVQEWINFQLDPDARDSFAEWVRMESYASDSRVVERVSDELEARSVNNVSSPVWARAIAELYKLNLGQMAGINFDSRELVDQTIRTARGNGPERVPTVNNVIKVFGYSAEDGGEVILRVETESAPDSTGKTQTSVKEVTRDFKMEIFGKILAPSVVTPVIYEAVRADYGNLNRLYQLNNNGGLPDNFYGCLVAACDQIIQESQDIAWDSPMQIRYGWVEFSEAEKENWSGLRKFLFRVGEPGTDKIRRIATDLKARLEAAPVS
ncbi:MAG: hypothetical protein Q8Q20_03665 [bacterium]|nr:hypothetical protein [bacterium]